MPGIFGVAMKSPDLEQVLTKMRDAMTLYPHFHKDDHFAGQRVAGSRVHLGKIGQLRSPYVGDGGRRIWLEGEVYNLPDVLAEFGWTGPRMENKAVPLWLLHAYQVGKLDCFLNRLDGYFCVAIYDPQKRKILLVSDRHGLRMLYWYHHKGVFAWASEVKGLLAIDSVDKTIDQTSLPCFMDLGYLMGEHTWFEHIRLIKPASIYEYEIDSDTLTQRYYWTWGEIKPSDLTFDEAVDALYEAFIKSVRRRFDPAERIGISLSGGLDSRAIFAAVNQLYPAYRGYAFTFGIPGCHDIRIAKQVVERSDWRHEEFHFSNLNWFQPRKAMIWNTDGMFDMTHMHGGEFVDHVAKNIDINMNGYLGGEAFGDTYQEMERYRSVESRIDSSRWSAIYKDYMRLSDAEDAFFDIRHIEPFHFINRSRRFILMGPVNSEVQLSQRFPQVDNGIFNVLFAIPDRYRVHNRLYSAMLQRHFPKYFRDIPWQKTGKPAGVISASAKTLPIRAVKKLVRIAMSYAGTTHSKRLTNYSEWIRDPAIAGELHALLARPNSHYRNLTQDDWQRSYLEPHLRSHWRDMSCEILRAATVELYLRRVTNAPSSPLKYPRPGL